jgi:hypothetical protein
MSRYGQSVWHQEFFMRVRLKFKADTRLGRPLTRLLFLPVHALGILPSTVSFLFGS